MAAGTTPNTIRFENLAEAAIRAISKPALEGLRRRAAERFEALGLPTTRQEAWRFTDLGPLGRLAYAIPAAGAGVVAHEALEPFLFPAAGGSRLVFVDGRYAQSLSHVEGLPKGATVRPLAGLAESEIEALGRIADAEGHAFVALNTASWTDGALISIADGTALEAPMHLLFLGTTGDSAVVSQPRVLLQIGRGAQATVVESYGSAGDGKALTNAVTEAWLADGAVLDHYRIQRQAAATYHFGTLAVRQSRASSFRSFAFSAGARINRTEIRTVFDAEGASCALNGLYLGRDRQLVDHQTSIDHATPHGTSTELYKGILDDRSRAVFNGEIIVRPDAQKSNARQTNKNLILSDETAVNSKPQLQIFANDVQCAHGATVGQLDADSLYYMRTRGIPADRAARLLTFAFASELIDEIRIPGLRDLLFRSLFADLPRVEDLSEHV